MGVYIKGMEMPTSLVLFCIHPDGKIFADLEGGWREYTAIPAKAPHGRLIDADAALRDGWTISRTYSASPTEMVYEAKAIDCLPIIIPAEEGE